MVAKTTRSASRAASRPVAVPPGKRAAKAAAASGSRSWQCTRPAPRPLAVRYRQISRAITPVPTTPQLAGLPGTRVRAASAAEAAVRAALIAADSSRATG